MFISDALIVNIHFSNKSFIQNLQFLFSWSIEKNLSNTLQAKKVKKVKAKNYKMFIYVEFNYKPKAKKKI